MNILNMVYTLRFFSLQNAVCFIILTYLVPVLIYILFTGCAKIKKKIPAPKRSRVLLEQALYRGNNAEGFVRRI